MNWVIAYFAAGAVFVCAVGFVAGLVEDTSKGVSEALLDALLTLPIWPVMLCVMLGAWLKRPVHD